MFLSSAYDGRQSRAFFFKSRGWFCIEVRSSELARFTSIMVDGVTYNIKLDKNGIGKIVLLMSKCRISIPQDIDMKISRLAKFYALRLMLKKLRLNSIRPKLDCITEDYLAIFSNKSYWNVELGESICNKHSFSSLFASGMYVSRQPNVSHYDVSIVIPTFGRLDLVTSLIQSIRDKSFTTYSYEIVIGEDASPSSHLFNVGFYENIRVVVNEENLGFLRNVNQLVKKCEGKYIVILNNDTLVTPNWLDELVYPLIRNENVGLTGSQLLYPDGFMQEAGGIVWSSGQPWNVAKGMESMHYAYNYTRDVDYISGASICLRRSDWEALCGFDDYFQPAYYEDTDLAFRVKHRLRKRVVYCPLSKVIHLEGQSHGTDEDSGIKSYQKVNAAKFKHRWKSSFKLLGSEGVDLHLHKDRNITFRILFIDATTPEPDKDAGSVAALNEMSMFQSLGGKVTFIPENLAYMDRYTRDLQRLGIEAVYAPYFMSVQAFIESRLDEFDAVFITRYSIAEKYVGIIRSLTPSKPIIFNNADLHFLREFRENVNSVPAKVCTTNLAKRRDRELAVLESVDRILVYTSQEKAALESHFIDPKSIILNSWVLEQREKVEKSKLESIAFLGGYRHRPNVEAIEWFVDHVFDQLLQVFPKLVLNVYGSNMPDSLRECLGGKSNINVLGYVKCLDDVFTENHIFIAPLQSGAGIKGKVLEAMAYGLPCVLSPVAAEGTGLSDGIDCLVADEPCEWIESISRLFNQPALWEKLSERSHERARLHFSRSRMRLIYKNICNDLRIIR